MKKCVEMFLILVLLFCGISFAEDKLVAPKELTTTEAKLYADWNKVCKEAEQACAIYDYDKASELYLKYSSIGEQLNRMDLKAWGLNNAGYMLIKKHALDKWDAKDLFKADYENAKKLLEQCLAVKGVKEKTIELAKKNIKHIDERLK